MSRPLAVVAMSGGVDSSLAAALLLDAGYRVRGVTLRLWESPRTDERICSDWSGTRRVAEHLGIEHVVFDRRPAFEREVVAPLVDAYASGRTPNPCVACNSRFKLGELVDWAIAEGAELVATGHYARADRENGRATLRRGLDPLRDQSYFLFQLSRRHLDRSAFPLGTLSKREVREHARRLRLPVADRRDSQDLCLGSPAALLAARGAGGRPGEIVTEAGMAVGRHRGIEVFTVGQRRGLGLAAAKPLYVQALEPASDRVVVADRPPRATALVARDWHWLADPPAERDTLTAQIRHRHPGVAARVEATGTAGRCHLRFESPAIAVTPGQAVVLYRDDEVLGGGWIESAG